MQFCTSYVQSIGEAPFKGGQVEDSLRFLQYLYVVLIDKDNICRHIYANVCGISQILNFSLNISPSGIFRLHMQS